jgi:hypothetical protein
MITPWLMPDVVPPLPISFSLYPIGSLIVLALAGLGIAGVLRAAAPGSRDVLVIHLRSVVARWT